MTIGRSKIIPSFKNGNKGDLTHHWDRLILNKTLNQGALTDGEMLSAVYFLVLNCLDQLLFQLKILFTFVTKQAGLMRRSTVLSLTFS
jgi:hypothetical protein